MPSDRNGVPFPPVRRLGPDDLRHCVRLSVDRGWLPEKAKWSLLLEESDAFGIDAPDGEDGEGAGDGALAGAVVLTRYGADLASVGMMLVAARHSRLGLGRALMEHLLAEAGDATVTLFATDLGKPLYDTQERASPASPPPGRTTRPRSSAPLSRPTARPPAC